RRCAARQPALSDARGVPRAAGQRPQDVRRALHSPKHAAPAAAQDRARDRPRRARARKLVRARAGRSAGAVQAQPPTLERGVNAMPEFIFMLTRDDKTLPDAREVFRRLASVGVRHVGCKDIGLPESQLAEFLDEARGSGASTYLEVVSMTPEDELRSAE